MYFFFKLWSTCIVPDTDLELVKSLKCDLYDILLVSMDLDPVTVWSTSTCHYKITSKNYSTIKIWQFNNYIFLDHPSMIKCNFLPVCALLTFLASC